MGTAPNLGPLATLACLLYTVSSAASPNSPEAPTLRFSPYAAAGVWAVAQFIPSPLLVMSSHHLGGGMRWQVTPLLYSFGITTRPWRAFVVEPIARHAGSIELFGSPEWACCAPNGRSSWLGRVGTRIYLPLLERGEMLSWSIGGSYHFGPGSHGGAGELGIFTLSGFLGLSVTWSPTLERREVIAALSIRVF